jgi:hypothetical protein
MLDCQMLRVLAAVLSMILLNPERAAACTSPPKHLTVPHTELVKRAPRIALARFEKGGAKSPPLFRTSEVLKGKVPPTFRLAAADVSSPSFKDPPGADFGGHRDASFWETRDTRESNGADCQMHPRFELGATYLIFLDPPYHWRAFERIDRADDLWLIAVRDLVRTPSQSSGLVVSAKDHLRSQRSVFLARIRRCFVADALYRHEVELVEMLSGAPAAQIMFLDHRRMVPCDPGTLVVATIHAGSHPYLRSPSNPSGCVLPFVTTGGKPAKAVSDQLRVDLSTETEVAFRGVHSPTLAELREMLK